MKIALLAKRPRFPLLAILKIFFVFISSNDSLLFFSFLSAILTHLEFHWKGRILPFSICCSAAFQSGRLPLVSLPHLAILSRFSDGREINQNEDTRTCPQPLLLLNIEFVYSDSSGIALERDSFVELFHTMLRFSQECCCVIHCTGALYSYSRSLFRSREDGY